MQILLLFYLFLIFNKVFFSVIMPQYKNYIMYFYEGIIQTKNLRKQDKSTIALQRYYKILLPISTTQHAVSGPQIWTTYKTTHIISNYPFQQLSGMKYILIFLSQVKLKFWQRFQGLHLQDQFQQYSIPITILCKKVKVWV